MIKGIKKHIGQNKGDIYIQMIFAIIIFMFLMILVMQLFSVFSQKMWLDEQLDDVVTLVSLSGYIPLTANECMETVARRMGGTSVFVYTRNDNDNSITYTYTWDEETQQLSQTYTAWSVNEEMSIGTMVTLRYTNDDYEAISIDESSWFTNFQISYDIDITRTAIVTARGVITET